GKLNIDDLLIKEIDEILNSKVELNKEIEIRNNIESIYDSDLNSDDSTETQRRKKRKIKQIEISKESIHN
ncbi:6817_t:CDS:1, partial [Dentiscutata erythropus]